jgi:hypothetical protein
MHETVYSLRDFRVENAQYFMALYTHLWPLLYIRYIDIVVWLRVEIKIAAIDSSPVHGPIPNPD